MRSSGVRASRGVMRPQYLQVRRLVSGLDNVDIWVISGKGSFPLSPIQRPPATDFRPSSVSSTSEALPPCSSSGAPLASWFRSSS